jgi:hypothetical protein
MQTASSRIRIRRIDQFLNHPTATYNTYKGYYYRGRKLIPDRNDSVFTYVQNTRFKTWFWFFSAFCLNKHQRQWVMLVNTITVVWQSACTPWVVIWSIWVFIYWHHILYDTHKPLDVCRISTLASNNIPLRTLKHLITIKKK